MGSFKALSLLQGDTAVIGAENDNSQGDALVPPMLMFATPQMHENYSRNCFQAMEQPIISLAVLSPWKKTPLSLAEHHGTGKCLK